MQLPAVQKVFVTPQQGRYIIRKPFKSDHSSLAQSKPKNTAANSSAEEALNKRMEALAQKEIMLQERENSLKEEKQQVLTKDIPTLFVWLLFNAIVNHFSSGARQAGWLFGGAAAFEAAAKATKVLDFAWPFC